MTKSKLIGVDAPEPDLSSEQQSILNMLDMMREQVIAGSVNQVAVITSGPHGTGGGINVGFNDVDYGAVMIGVEMLKGMVMARLTEPKGRQTILRPGVRRQ